MEPIFEINGYFKDYYVDGKFIGNERCEKDRDVFGYEGRKKEILQEDKILGKSKKKIKKGTLVITELQIICGRVKK